MRISDWSSDVCSSDLDWHLTRPWRTFWQPEQTQGDNGGHLFHWYGRRSSGSQDPPGSCRRQAATCGAGSIYRPRHRNGRRGNPAELDRSEEHTSELQSLMRISYAVFCLKQKKNKDKN